MLVSFDLFGTLVTAARPSDPATAVAAALGARDVDVPSDWDDAYRDPHRDLEPTDAHSLFDHVADALASRGVDADPDVVADAVLDAFDGDVTTCSGAHEAVDAAAVHGPVGVLSNCSVPGLAQRALDRSTLDARAFDAVVVSVDLGWRKPGRRAFEAAADALGGTVDALVHVGDDPRTDGGIIDVGGTFVSLDDTPLRAVPERLEAVSC